ncbi:MAG: VUT family protein [Clostridia bacterium]|nr:VUT family protein [Clostridia bacterium]
MRKRIKQFLSDTSLLLRSIPSPVITVLVLSVVLMNLLANKTIYQKGFFAVDGGIVVSWACFLCMDIITKHFGAKAATQASIFALAINLFCVGIFAIVSLIPTETDYSAFNGIFGGSWFIVLSSSLAFIASAVANNALNAAVGRMFRANPDGRAAYYTRSYVSTFIGQFIDNMVFASLVFMLFAPIYWGGFSWTLPQCISCSMIGAFLELFMEVVFSPIGYSVTRRWRQMDVGGAYLAAHAA